jgi:uncharacterized membrane protein
MTVDSRVILDEYLRALEDELRSLSPSDRAEIILEVREHYEEARRELPGPTEADLRNIVERLGAPAEIATEARARLGVTEAGHLSQPAPIPPAPPQSTSSAGALEIAALIGWIVWMPVGILLMALSSRWSRTIKARAVAVELAFLAVLLGVFTTPIYLTSHVSLSHLPFFFPLLLVFPPTVFGFAGSAYLTWKLLSPGGRKWGTAWKAAGVVVGGWLLWVLVLGPLTLLVMRAQGGG